MRIDVKTDPIIVRALFNTQALDDRVQLHSFDTPAQVDQYITSMKRDNPSFMGAVVRQRGTLLDIVV